MDSTLSDDALRLKAAIEFGSEFLYTIRFGTMGKTLYISTESKSDAVAIRQRAPTFWEELYVVVLCTGGSTEEDTEEVQESWEDEELYDEELS